jgi:hypothetical protein
VEKLTKTELASFLHRELKNITYLAYKVSDDKKYSSFSIPKKGGGYREIDAPVMQLKELQKTLQRFLDTRLFRNNEIWVSRSGRGSFSHGVRKGTWIFTNAARHAGKRYVFNIDIEDFFGSINYGRLFGALIADNQLKIERSAATIISAIAIHKNRLPQGSPCSPIVSEIIGRIIDRRLSVLAAKFHCTYSRYIDDISFSTNRVIFPTEIAFRSASRSEWMVGKALQAEFSRLGFRIKASKVRMNTKVNRQIVTGLTVNKAPNVSSNYSRDTRAMVDNLFKKNEYYIDEEKFSSYQKLEGRLVHIYQIKDAQRKEYNLEKRTLLTSNYRNFTR